MVVVAIAGGTGSVGRMMTDEIVRTGRHEVVVLTRQDPGPTDAAAAEPACTSVQVDYQSVDALAAVLRDRLVDTVISTMNLHWPGGADAQLNLIRAAAASGTVTRFVPSEFNVDYNLPEDIMPYPPRVLYQRAQRELEAHPQLTHMLVRNGFFMDYLGQPYHADTHLLPLYCVVDLAARAAVIPGDGRQPVVLTTTRDVARCVAALLDRPAAAWPVEAAVVGERTTLNALVDVVDHVLGVPVARTHDDLADLRRNRTTELPSNRACYAAFPHGRADLDLIICTQMVGMATGAFDVPGLDLHALLPDVERTRLEPFLRACVANAATVETTRTAETAETAETAVTSQSQAG